METTVVDASECGRSEIHLEGNIHDEDITVMLAGGNVGVLEL